MGGAKGPKTLIKNVRKTVTDNIHIDIKDEATAQIPKPSERGSNLL
jgi:hypothetical protein